MRFASIAAVLTAPLLVCAMPMKHKRASDADILVLQFAEVLERLETQFYQDALDKFVEQDFLDAGINVPDVAIQNFQSILEHEIAHTDFLNAALQAVGASPVEGCTFNFDAVLTDVATMAAVARVVEAVGVGAYIGAGTLVDDKNILVAAASILTIEARHQTILNSINGATSVPQSFDIALTPPQVLSIAGGFISGCSLGVEANPPVSITNQGAVTPGTLLTFDSPALAAAGGAQLSCQMLVGGGPTALSFPVEECVVPEGLNGPVAIFLTTDPTPLSSNVVVQDASIILAGPTLAFIDTIPDALGSLIRAGGAPLDSFEDLSPEDAQRLIGDANGQVGPAPVVAPPAGGEQVTDPALDPVGGDDGAAEQVTDPALDPIAAPADTVAPPADVAAPPADGAAPPTTVPPLRVVGHSQIPA